jgi:hypothetical protein
MAVLTYGFFHPKNAKRVQFIGTRLAGFSSQDQPGLGAGTLHLHVRVDGEDRCIFASAHCPDADRHADLDFARPDGADLPVHADRSADGFGGAEAVHRHREVRDHGDSVLHSGRQFPDSRRRGAAHDRLRHRDASAIGHGGLGLAGVLACALFAAVSGSSPATVVAIGSILLPAMVAARLSQTLRRRRHHHVRGAGHPDSAVDRHGVCSGMVVPDQGLFHLGRAVVHRRRHSRPDAGHACSALTTWYRAWKNNYPRECRKPRGGHAGMRSARQIWGLLLIVMVMGGIYTGLFTPTEAAAMSAVYAFVVAVFVYKDIGSRTCRRCCSIGEHERDAALHHHQRRAVLVPDDAREHSAGDGQWMIDQHRACGSASCWVNIAAAAGGQCDGAVVDRPDHGADPVPDRDQAGHRSGAFRHHDGGQHGSRHVPSAGRPEPLCRLRHHQDGHHRTDRGGLAVAADHAGVPGHRDLLATAVALAADSWT